MVNVSTRPGGGIFFDVVCVLKPHICFDLKTTTLFNVFQAGTAYYKGGYGGVSSWVLRVLMKTIGIILYLQPSNA